MPGPGVPNASRPGFSLRQPDQVRHRVDRQRRIDHQHERHAREERDRREVLARIVGKVLAHGDVDREHRARRHHDGVAVRRRVRDRRGRRHAAAARPVLHHERLAQALLEPLAQHAGEQAGHPAGRKRHDEGDRPVRVVGRLRRGAVGAAPASIAIGITSTARRGSKIIGVSSRVASPCCAAAASRRPDASTRRR